jgi:hypothetical protein
MRSGFFRNDFLLFSIFISISIVSFSIYSYSNAPTLTGKVVECLNRECSTLKIPSSIEAKQKSYQAVTSASNAEIYAEDISSKDYSSLTKNELIKYQSDLYSSYTDVKSIYDDSSLLVKFYGSNPVIRENHDKIKISLNSVKEKFLDVHIKLIDKSTKMIEDRMKLAKQEVRKNELIDENKIKLERYYKNPFPVVSEDLQDEDCSMGIAAAAFNDALDVGNVGVSSNGLKCVIPQSNLEPIVSLGSNGQLLPPSFAAFYVNPSSSISEDSNFEAIAVVPGPQGLQLGFFLAPSHTAIESEIASFIENLIFGKSSISEDNSDVLVRPNQLPWTLYLILIGLFIEFLFFDLIFLSSAERIINRGNSALDDKNYPVALDSYHKLTKLYPDMDFFLKEQTFDYFTNLKTQISFSGFKAEIKLPNELFVGDKSPNIENQMTHKERVKIMIYDALRKCINNRKIALARLPLISEAYKNLDKKSRESLAPIYEKLVYTLKHSN